MNDLDGREAKDNKGVSPTRIGIWVVVGAIGLYLVASGVIGILSGGN